MLTASIPLTDDENLALEALSESRGQSREELLRDAVRHFLAQHDPASRLHALRKARGMWQNRDDLPDLSTLRREWDRLP